MPERRCGALFCFSPFLPLAGGSRGAQTPHTHQHDFSGAERWAGALDDPARDRWQNPHEVIQALRLAPDATVADIGAGTGYFSARLAHMTPKGRIFAVDVEPAMVRHLHRACPVREAAQCRARARRAP